jgi:hypothetical protein
VFLCSFLSKQAGATGSGAVAGLNKPRPSLEVSGAEQYQRVEEQARWWEQQWLALEAGDDSALGRRFGLFAGGAGGSFVNMASPAGTASLSATLTRPHFGGNTATWLSPLRTLASYDLTHRVPPPVCRVCRVSCATTNCVLISNAMHAWRRA